MTKQIQRVAYQLRELPSAAGCSERYWLKQIQNGRLPSRLIKNDPASKRGVRIVMAQDLEEFLRGENSMAEAA